MKDVLILHSFVNHPSKTNSAKSVGYHISDESLELAITSLEASTASIEKQCRLLEAQKRAIEDIIRRNTSTSESKNSSTQQSSKSSHEKAQLEFSQAELSSSLRSQLTTASKQAESVIASMPSAIERILDKDDRLLDGLEKILPNLSAADDSAAGVDEVDQLCKALTKQWSADIRSQIDATYQNSTQSNNNVYTNGNHSATASRSTNDQRAALQSELEELCREIDGLSTMAVENQYRIPISRALRTSREDIEAERAAWKQYLSAILTHLTARLDIMNDHFEHAHAHSAALKSVQAAFEGVMAAVVDKKLASAAGVGSTSSPSKQSQKGLKPLRLVQANLSENQDPVVQLLKGLDVKVTERDDPARFAEGLAASVREQRQKLAAFGATTEKSVSDLISQSLSKVERDSGTLYGAAFGESEYGTVKLLNGNVQGAVDDLEEKTQRMGDEMRGVDVSEVAGVLREKQRAVIEKLQE